MGEEREKKTKTKTKQQQNATEMNIRGNWVKCIRALSVPFLLFFCKVDYSIKLSDKNVMQQIGNSRDLAYLITSFWTLMKRVLFTSLMLCVPHPHSSLNNVVI